MFELGQLGSALLLIFLPLLVTLLIYKSFIPKTTHEPNSQNTSLPKPYPIVGHLFAILQHKHDRLQWITNLINSSPSSTIVFHRLFGLRSVYTANPATVEHILKTHFLTYEKGAHYKAVLGDVLGDGIFNADGDTWKFQRQIASHEFCTKSLRKFVETVVDSELNDRLIPILSEAAKNHTVLDFQDILQRFGFDTICKIAFGYDPEYLSPALPQTKFAVAFEDAVMLVTMRFRAFFPILWKIGRFLNVGSERKLKEAVLEVRGFAHYLVKQKKQEMQQGSEGVSSSEATDLLSRFLKSGHSDEKFVTDIVMCFILAGRDSASAILTWLFWFIHKHKHVEEAILKEVQTRGKQNKKTEHSSIFEEVKDMVYTHAALCETMRLYPPIPADAKEAMTDDILPDGTPVKKGTRVTYNSYAMGRSEKIWGSDWAEFRPNRWLQMNDENGENDRVRFVGHSQYSYPVFHAGPRICLGKDMVFLQMKRVVAGVLARFRVVPAVEEGFEPVYVPLLNAKMKGGLPVRLEERVDT